MRSECKKRIRNAKSPSREKRKEKENNTHEKIGKCAGTKRIERLIKLVFVYGVPMC